MSKERMEKSPIEKDFEAEAKWLQERAMEQIDEMPLWDPEEGFADLMARVERGDRASLPSMNLEEEEADAFAAAPKTDDGKMTGAMEVSDEPKRNSPKTHRTRKIRWKMVAVLAAALVLVLAMGTGTIGEKVYTPEAVTEHKDGEVVIKINNEERIERNVEEESVYQEIEDRLGILALRLGYKPQGMELYKVEILEEFGDARIQYLYNEQIFAMYMSRDYSSTDLNIKTDSKGSVVDTVDSFWLNKKIEILEMKNEDGIKSYLVELEEKNVVYIIDGAMELEDFLKIINEIYIKNT